MHVREIADRINRFTDGLSKVSVSQVEAVLDALHRDAELALHVVELVQGRRTAQPAAADLDPFDADAPQ